MLFRGPQCPGVGCIEARRAYHQGTYSIYPSFHLRLLLHPALFIELSSVFLPDISQPPCVMGQTFSEVFPPSPRWSVNDIPDLTGKVMVVTGAVHDSDQPDFHILSLVNASIMEQEATVASEKRSFV